jgi:hypothetical protein
MIFTETKLKGAYVIDLEQRGRRARFLCPRLLPARVRGPRSEAWSRKGSSLTTGCLVDAIDEAEMTDDPGE